VNARPAILGGPPAFDEPLPIIRPTIAPIDEWEADLRAVLASGIVTVGPMNGRLERAVAEYLDVPEVVAVANCTSGLMLAVQALGLPPNAEVIVPSFTFAATVHAVVWNGLRPTFADSRLDTCAIDPESVEEAITGKTGAIMATDIFGVPADVAPLARIAEDHGLPLLFDSAQSLGATYRGARVGGFGVAQVFSMSPTKVVTALEGGLIATRDDSLAARLRRGRDYGKNTDGMDMEFVGLSARLSEVHALVGHANFLRIDDLVEARRERIGSYQEHLSKLPGIRYQAIPSDRTTSGNYMVVFVEADGFGLTRNELYEALARENIQTKKYFHPPVHSQTAFRQWHDGRPLPVAERLAEEGLALPLWSHLDPATIDRVVEAIKVLHKHAPDVRTSLTEDGAG